MMLPAQQLFAKPFVDKGKKKKRRFIIDTFQGLSLPIWQAPDGEMLFRFLDLSVWLPEWQATSL